MCQKQFFTKQNEKTLFSGMSIKPLKQDFSFKIVLEGQ